MVMLIDYNIACSICLILGYAYSLYVDKFVADIMSVILQ